MPRNPGIEKHSHANPEATRGKRWSLSARVAEFEQRQAENARLEELGIWSNGTLAKGAKAKTLDQERKRSRREYWQLKQLHRDTE